MTPRITILYAWDTPAPLGETYEDADEARAEAPPNTGIVRLYVDPDGRIVHTEPVEKRDV